MNESVAQRDPIEQLAEEFMDRMRRGERPSVSEYAAAHPALADEIRDLFPALMVMEEVKPGCTEPHAAPVAPEAVPERLGEYRILREVGRGGMGVVYEAEQIALGRHVALKVLPGQAGGDPMRLLRFRREARSAARLHHTNIVPVFDVGSADGAHYYAMQYIQGQGLDEVLRELRRLRSGEQPTATADLTGSLVEGLRTGVFAAAPIVPVPRPVEPRSETSAMLTGSASHYCRSVAGLGVQAAEALAYAHGQRVLHRDVKPSNLLLDKQGTLWLTDFGLAKDDTEDLTRTGDVVGTMRYMAPERFQGVSDPRTDVYALGVTLYELLTLRPAFPEADRVLLLRRIAHEEPPRPRAVDPTIPRDLETIVLKAIEKEPARRYSTAADMADDLRRFLADRPIKARRASWREQAWRWCRRNPGVAASLSAAFAFLVLLVVGLSIGALLVWREKRAADAALAEEKVAAYFQRIALADRELAANHVSRAEDLLAQCPPELRCWEWNYLNRNRGRQPKVTFKHPHPTHGKAALSPDGRWLATAGRNGVVTVWDVVSGEHREILAHQTNCWSVAFSADSRVLISVNDEPEKVGVKGEARFWDPATGKPCRPPWPLGDVYFNIVAFSPVGTRLAVTSYLQNGKDDSVELRDEATGKPVLKLGTHSGSAQGLQFSPDGSILVSAGEDHVLRAYKADTGRVLFESSGFPRGKRPFRCVAFSPDGKRVAAGFGNENEMEPGGVRIWEVGTWRELPRLSGHDTFGLAWGPDGRLATGGNDATVRVWDAERGLELLTLRGHTDLVREVFFTPDGHRLLSVSEDRTVWVWDATPVGDGEHLGDERQTLRGHTNGVKPLAFHPTRPVLVSGGSDGRVLEWDTRDWLAPPRILLTAGKPVHALVYLRDGAWLAVGGEAVTGATLLDARTGDRKFGLESEAGSYWPHRLSPSPDSRLLAGGGLDGRLVIWDTSTRAAKPFPRTLPWCYGVAFGPDVRRPLLAVVSTSSGVTVYHPGTGEVVKPLEHPGGTGISFDRDGTRLASVGWDNVIRVWRTDSWALIEKYRDHGGGPNSVAFSPNGKLVAWGGVDATVKVWKLGTDHVETLRGHRNWVWDVAFSPEGDVIASAGRDGTVKIWKTPTFGAK